MQKTEEWLAVGRMEWFGPGHLALLHPVKSWQCYWDILTVTFGHYLSTSPRSSLPWSCHSASDLVSPEETGEPRQLVAKNSQMCPQHNWGMDAATSQPSRAAQSAKTPNSCVSEVSSPLRLPALCFSHRSKITLKTLITVTSFLTWKTSSMQVRESQQWLPVGRGRNVSVRWWQEGRKGWCWWGGRQISPVRGADPSLCEVSCSSTQGPGASSLSPKGDQYLAFPTHQLHALGTGGIWGQ